MHTQKENAQDFLVLTAKGKARKAFAFYVGHEFRHHNVYFNGDAESLMHAMDESAKANPDRIFEIKRALVEGELVAVHSHVRQSADDLGVALVHIFRFENHKIVEMWDIGQAVPADSVNENGMF